VVFDEGIELTDHLSMPTERELGVDQVLPCRKAELFEALDLSGREGLVSQVAERRAAPECEGRLKARGALLRRVCRARIGHELFEAQEIKL
jgi:hypothetical protein